MRYLSAYLLAVLGGNPNPDKSAIKNILSVADVSVDDAAIEKVINDLSGKNIEELIAEGRGKLNEGQTRLAAAPQAVSAAPEPVPVAKEEKEKKEVKKEESDDEVMAMGLFDDE